jgi:hypothetical protein
MKHSFLVACGLVVSSATYAAPDPSEIGDSDSFGRNVIYLGLAGTPPLVFKTNCTVSPPAAPARCVTMAAQPAMTSFVETKLASLTIPANSTNSLLCFALTPSMNFQLRNQTGVPQPTARFWVRPTVVIENPLLNDPTLIDPTTGAPFNGKIAVSLVTYMESRSMAVNESEMKQIFLSRNCIEGLIAKRGLEGTYGLPQSLVDDFFKQDITLTFGAAGDVQLVTNATYYFGIRLYGDAP